MFTCFVCHREITPSKGRKPFNRFSHKYCYVCWSHTGKDIEELNELKIRERIKDIENGNVQKNKDLQIIELQNRIIELETQNQEQNSHMDKIRNKFSELKDAHKEIYDNITSENDSLIAQIISFEIKVQELQKENDQLQEKYNKLDSDLLMKHIQFECKDEIKESTNNEYMAIYNIGYNNQYDLGYTGLE